MGELLLKPGRCRMGRFNAGAHKRNALSSHVRSKHDLQGRSKDVCFVRRGAPLSLGCRRSAPVVVKPVPRVPVLRQWAVCQLPPRSVPVRRSLRPCLAPPAVSPIVQTVERRLRESSYYYLRSIRCAFEAGVITLRGRVPTFYLKQTVQAIVEKIEGVEQVVNLVEVFDSRQAPFPASDARPERTA